MSPDMLQGSIRELACDPSHDGCQQATAEHALIALDLRISHVALKHQGPGLSTGPGQTLPGLTQTHPRL